MAMLAESKRKHQGYALQPRGKPLYEDANSFGSKMLSKMGWEPGKGLGAHEDGSVNFIKIKYKNDIQGIGYEARDDQWTQHETVFNNLLSSLSNQNSDDISEDDRESKAFEGFSEKKIEYKPSGESLEEKSKKSRARVHYKKFTKGKDISQYSHKDLANIFGKTTNKDEINFSGLSKISNKDDDKEENDPQSSSIVTVTSNISSTDYFKNKLKEKFHIKKNEDEIENDVAVDKRIKKRKADRIGKAPKDSDKTEINHKKLAKSYDNTNTTVSIEGKKIKNKLKVLEEPALDLNSFPIIKKKKSKHYLASEENSTNTNPDEEKTTKQKKKRSKTKNIEVSITPEPLVLESPVVNTLKINEIEFNRIRSEQICNYLKSCQRILMKTTLSIHPIIAEIIRNANVQGYRNSNLDKLIGYGLTEDVSMEVKPGQFNLKSLLEKPVTCEQGYLIF